MIYLLIAGSLLALDLGINGMWRIISWKRISEGRQVENPAQKKL